MQSHEYLPPPPGSAGFHPAHPLEDAEFTEAHIDYPTHFPYHMQHRNPQVSNHTKRETTMDKCHVDGCTQNVSKPGHKLCYDHWNDEKDGIITPCEACEKYKDNDYPLCKKCFDETKNKQTKNGDKKEQKGDLLAATAIGKQIGLSSQKVNLIFEEMGWLTNEVSGWTPTSLGLKFGA
ncbi:MAG: hypothetical protein ABIG42_07805, partial [bacterium]